MICAAPCLRLQIQPPLAGHHQQRPGGGIGCGQRTARDHAAHAAQQLGQHRHTGGQLAAHPALPQQVCGPLPHGHTQQDRQQQPAAQRGAPQHRLVQPRGGQLFQLLQYGRRRQRCRGQQRQHQTPPRPAAVPLCVPQQVLRQRFGLRRLFLLRLVLRLIEELLRVLKPGTALLTAAALLPPLGQRRQLFTQGHGLLDDAVVPVLQHRVHGLAHNVLQRHPIRRVGLIQLVLRRVGGVLRRGGFLLRRCFHDRGRFLRRGRLRRLGRLTPTLAVLGQDGFQRILVLLGDACIAVSVVSPAHSSSRSAFSFLSAVPPHTAE